MWQDLRLQDGEAIVSISETQLTSLLAAKLNENPVFYNGQIYLQDGLLQLFGTYDQGLFRAAFLLAIQPVLNAQGGLGFEVITAELGESPAPDRLLEGASAVLTEAFTGSIGSLATGLKISGVEIADGLMILRVSLR